MYNLSKDYEKLYSMLCQDHIAVGFVDYDFYRDNEHPPVRDVVRIRRFKEYEIRVGVRGTQYGGVDTFYKELSKEDGLNLTEKDIFIKDCQRMNLEWIDPDTDEKTTCGNCGEEVEMIVLDTMCPECKC